MAPKPKPKVPLASSSPSPSPSRSRGGNPFKDRLGLGAYISSPDSFPPSIIIYQNADFVAIHDKYPKSTIHTLLLPRSPAHNLLHPYEAFQDTAFLKKVQAESVKLKALVAAELQRRLGRYSKQDAAREAVLNGEVDADADADAGDEEGQGQGQREGKLPSGRDWESEVVVGVHAVPSMTHLHVHVLSRDMHSGSMRHRKHYNSFNTPFLVDVMDFPLGEGDARLDPREQAYLRRDLKCWRCGKGFGNRFAKLKEHLEGEFEAWRAE
jgi:aprataxin